MVVGFLTTEYPSEPFFAGGLASYLGRVAEALVSAGHTCEVFVVGDSAEEYVQNGVRVIRVRTDNRLQRRFKDARFFWRYLGLAHILDRATALEQAVYQRSKTRRIDVVQAPDYLAPGLSLAWRTRVPVVTRISHYAPLVQAAYRRPGTPTLQQQNVSERHQLLMSRAVYAPSRFLAQTVARAERIEVGVLYPPFDVASIAQYSNDVPGFGLERDAYALFFGTIGLLKGADRILDVLPHVLAECPAMRFVFAGNVYLTASGERFDTVLRERFGDRVLVVPALRQPELLPLVAGARYVVLPSRVENLPNACLEALALGRPVIATQGVSFEELVDSGTNGILVPQDDAHALGRAMIDYWRLEPARRKEIGLAGQQRLAVFEPGRTLPPLVSLFETVVRQWLGPARVMRPFKAAAYFRDLGGVSRGPQWRL